MGCAILEAANSEEPKHRVTSVVRADSMSGHLVRTVVVSPRVVAPKSVGSLPAESASSTVASAGATQAELNDLVEEAAHNYNLDPALVHSIIKVESNYNQYAVSNKGAQGLMQLVPSTAKQLGVKNSFDARQNIDAGVRYYKYLKSIYGDDRLALAAYNAGEGAVAKYNFQVPPYPETVNYVYQVGKHWGETARKRRAQPLKPAEIVTEATEAPKLDTHPKLEQYRDDEGRIYIRTAKE
jgi:soluble lytic murein transglycosylase-like protein